MREFTSFDPTPGSGILKTNGVNKDEQLMIYNDSIYRIRFHFNDGSIGVVPALWNKDYIQKNIPLGDIKWEVVDSLNIANNPSLMVYGEVYEPDEHVASVNASMQRSVVSSIPGGVSTSVVSLESTGANTSPDGTNIITITDSLGNTFVLDNNGLLNLSTKIGTALVQLIKTSITDPLLQLGALTHIVEILGSLQVDTQINGPSAANLILNATTGNSVAASVNGTEVWHVDAGGMAILSKKIYDDSANNLADWTASGLFIKGNPANIGKFQYQGNGVNTDFAITAISRFTGTGSGTFSHGLKFNNLAIAPDIIIPVTSVAGSQTMGYDTVTTTQVHITTGAALAWVALAIKL